MADLYDRKNADYGDSFSQSIDEFGYVAGLVRIGDKFNRAKQLLLVQQGQFINDESVVDTLTDLANYAIMLRMEIEGRRGREEDSETILSSVYQEHQYKF